MILILIGNKKGKGNGKRAILEFSEEFIPSVNTDKIFFEQFNRLADECPKIRIQIGEERACSHCKSVLITKKDTTHCPACKQRRTKNDPDVLLKYYAHARGLCGECGEVLKNCRCRVSEASISQRKSRYK